jgi:hypothetical protein
MIAGHLREKNGHYYCVLSYVDYTGERKQIWKSTGLPVKGNKKRAEEMLSHFRSSDQRKVYPSQDRPLGIPHR